MRTRARTSVVALLVVASACAGGDDRPTVADWQPQWEQQRDRVPDVDAFLTGGRDLCSELVGRYREDLPKLRPTPTEALDDAVVAWIEHVEAIAFECPDDAGDLADRYETLDVLSAEIEAGVIAELDG